MYWIGTNYQLYQIKLPYNHLKNEKFYKSMYKEKKKQKKNKCNGVQRYLISGTTKSNYFHVLKITSNVAGELSD